MAPRLTYLNVRLSRRRIPLRKAAYRTLGSSPGSRVIDPLDAVGATPARVPARALAIWAAIVSVATLGVYAGHMGGEWIFDDFHTVVHNDRLEQLWPPAWAHYDHDHPLAARPAVALTIALNYRVSGEEPAGYRYFNLAIHLVNAILVLWIVARLLAWSPGLSLGGTERAGLAGATAVLWTLHPLMTEPVVYVSQRTELLVSFFYLLTLATALGRFGARTGRARAGWTALAVGACAAGALCKEVMVTAPLAVLVCDRAFVAGSFGGALRRRPGLYAGLAASWVVLGVLVATSPRTAETALFEQISPVSSLRTQGGNIAEYLRLAFWPDSLRVSFPPRAVRTWADLPPGAVAVAALFAATVWACWRYPRLGFAGAWLFLTLAPSSSVVPIVTEIAAQRRIYMGLIAVAALLALGVFSALRAWAGGDAGRRRVARNAGLALLAVACAGLAWRSADRLVDFRTRVSLWQADVRIDPRHPAALINLAMALADEGRPVQTASYLDRGLAALLSMDSKTRGLMIYSTSLDKVAALYQATGRAAHGIGPMQRLAVAHPDVAHAQLGFARLALAVGRPDDALAPLRRAAQLEPASSAAWIRLAQAHEMSGRTEQAIAALDEAAARSEGVARERLEARRRRLAAEQAANRP